MKKLIFVISAVCALLSVGTVTAFAADAPEQPKKNVTITVVIPEPKDEPAPQATDAPATPPKISNIYPSDVAETRDSGVWGIVKTYELGANENPADIPREDFERNGRLFKLTDIIRTETANAETREHTETVTLNTDTKDLEKIMPQLSQAMEFKAEDGFVGILNLDVASIKVETAGTKTTSHTLSVTREYPRLSANDTELVPKTVTDKGKTYTLAGVEWRAGNYSTVDYERIPDYYTAFATYTAAGSSTKITGYVTTAEYGGTLARMAQGKTVYTAYFLGEEIITPLEFAPPHAAGRAGTPVDPSALKPPEIADGATPDVAPSGEPRGEAAPEPTASPEPIVSDDEQTDDSAPIAWIAVTALLAAGCGIMCYFLRKQRKENSPL
jgi:hypothetical protein